MPLNKTEKQIAVVGIVVALVARWQALLPGYSIDDYSLYYEPVSAEWAFAISQGRIAVPAIKFLLEKLGAVPPHSSVVALFLLMIALLGAGLATSRLWRLQDRQAESTLVVLFVLLHPYQTEIFTFKTAALFMSIPLALGFWGLLTCIRSRRHWVLSLAATVVALTTYQTVLNYLAMAMLFSVVFELARDTRERASEFWRETWSRSRLLLTAVLLFGLTTIVTTVAGGGSLTGRATLIGRSEWGPRLVAVRTLMTQMFLAGEPVLPMATKFLLLAIPLIVFVHWCLRSAPRMTHFFTRRRLAAFLVALVFGVPACVGMILALNDWWPVPRVLSHTSLFWAGIASLSSLLSNGVARRVILATAAIVIFSFIGLDNRICNDQLRVNMRDLNEANRIVGRMEQFPEFDRVRELAVVGGYWGWASPISTTEGDLNASALFPQQGKLSIINEVSGYRFSRPAAAVSLQAEDYCRETHATWPSAESVVQRGALAIVCLKK